MSLVTGVRHPGASPRSTLIWREPFPAIVLACLALMFSAADAGAQEFRWVTGTVAAWTKDTLIVWLPAADLNVAFALDDESQILPSPHATVRQWPMPRWQLRQSFGEGTAIEVHYLRQPTRNYAAIIRAPSPGRRLVAGTSLAGVVSAVSDDEISVRADEKEETFAVEASTRIAAPQPRQDGETGPRRGERPKLRDYVGMQDQVLVFYRADAKPRVALEIAVLRKHK